MEKQPFDHPTVDSVSKTGLTTDDLTNLRKENPKTAFVYIFHTNKEGNFRGRQDFAHDVDAIINVERDWQMQMGGLDQVEVSVYTKIQKIS